jgi:hypothetical protein
MGVKTAPQGYWLVRLDRREKVIGRVSHELWRALFKVIIDGREDTFAVDPVALGDLDGFCDMLLHFMDRIQFFYVDFSCDLSTANALFGTVVGAHVAYSARAPSGFQSVTSDYLENRANSAAS